MEILYVMFESFCSFIWCFTCRLVKLIKCLFFSVFYEVLFSFLFWGELVDFLVELKGSNNHFGKCSVSQVLRFYFF